MFRLKPLIVQYKFIQRGRRKVVHVHAGVEHRFARCNEWLVVCVCVIVDMAVYHVTAFVYTRPRYHGVMAQYRGTAVWVYRRQAIYSIIFQYILAANSLTDFTSS